MMTAARRAELREWAEENVRRGWQEVEFLNNAETLELLDEIDRANALIVKIWDLAPSDDHRIADAIRQADFGGMISATKHETRRR